MLRQTIHCCRNFGTVSIVGVYGGYLDKIPMGSATNRGADTCPALPTATHGAHPKGEIDPSFIITHTGSLEDGPDLYKTFLEKKDDSVKVVLKP